ncbi:MAG: hypothetical protein K0S28_1973 [Paucimonas sp.]|jgi:hypothetical protein|nr:hypothetical protein [Paucimonas sp.]
MLKVIALIAIGIAVILSALLLFGALRWNTGTRDIRQRLDAARTDIRPQRVDFRELDRLPAPVRTYFRSVLKEGRPMIAGARLKHRGTFNMSEDGDQWRPFTSDQCVVTQRPGFDWDARIKMAPGVAVHVHDAYVGGEGILHASLLGVFTVADLRGGGDIAEGELMRFFAEAAWYPTALLPSQGMRWEAAGERSARATLTDGPITLAMLFTFNEQGLIDTVRAESRGRTVKGRTVPTPWQGRFWNYEWRGNVRVPTEGEVAWLLPSGPKPYWRGRVMQIDHEPCTGRGRAKND